MSTVAIKRLTSEDGALLHALDVIFTKRGTWEDVMHFDMAVP